MPELLQHVFIVRNPLVRDKYLHLPVYFSIRRCQNLNCAVFWSYLFYDKTKVDYSGNFVCRYNVSITEDITLIYNINYYTFKTNISQIKKLKNKIEYRLSVDKLFYPMYYKVKNANLIRNLVFQENRWTQSFTI